MAYSSYPCSYPYPFKPFKIFFHRKKKFKYVILLIKDEFQGIKWLTTARGTLKSVITHIFPNVFSVCTFVYHFFVLIILLSFHSKHEKQQLTLNKMATLVPTETLSGTPPSLAVPAQPSALSLSHQIGIAILVIAFVFGFPGNLFVVWSVLCRVRRRSVTCLLILNLAVADALVLLSAPLFLRYLAGPRGWEFGSTLCKTIHYLCCVNMYSSIYLICLMSMDRWLAVTKPFLSQRLRTKKRLLSVMLGIWVMAFLMALPMPFYRWVWEIFSGGAERLGVITQITLWIKK